MSYTSLNPEYLDRDPDSNSLASTSATATSDSEQSKKKKKPWSKFKKSIKSIGEKMSARPKFTDQTESSEQKRVKKGKKGKASSSGEAKSSTTEETPRESTTAKSLMKKLSVETISTPFVGYQPASVSPVKSYAKAVHKSGSTSESNLSASDIDTPKKSLTLDRNAKLAQESPDSGRASQAMGSLEGSRPPSQIKEEASDVSVDSDYTSLRHGGLEEEGLDELVTKTEQFAQSLVSPKGKEKDSDVSVEFLKAETVVDPPPSITSESNRPAATGDKQEEKDSDVSVEFLKAETVVGPPPSITSESNGPAATGDKQEEKDSDVSVEFLKAETVVDPPPSLTSESNGPAATGDKQEETPSQTLKEEKNDKISNLVDETKVVEEDRVDGRKKKRSDRESKKDDGSVSFIDSERSTAGPINPVNSETRLPQSKDAIKSNPSEEKPVPDIRKERSRDKDRSHGKKDSNRNKDNSVIKENKDADSNAKSETKSIPTTNEKKETTAKLDKENIKETPESKSKTTPNEKTDDNTPKSPKEETPKTDSTKKEDTKSKTPPTKSDDADKSPLPKSPTKTEDMPSPLRDLGPATPETSMTVEEKLQAFLSAEGWSGPTKDVPAKPSSDGSQQPDKRECLYKILVIGELGTGKTSIIKRYVHQFFSQHYRATIGVDFALKVLNWDSNTIIRLQLWDIAGQERFGNMTRVYYKEAVGAFIVFDVTRSATFDAVLKWKQDLDSKVQLADGSHIPCVLLANKCDQQKEGIVNTPAKMDEYCKENNFSAWFETSAKENINIDEAAKCLVTQILQNDKSSQNGRDSARDGGKFPLDGKSEEENKSCAC